MSIKIKVRTSGLQFDAEKETVSIDCPKCGTPVSVALGQIQREETLVCGNCQTSIKLRDKGHSANKAVSDINRAFGELKSALDDLGR
ncbi:MAG: hypothetical protein ABSC50_12910 [Candidatus Bathyarchaeia archaeon]